MVAGDTATGFGTGWDVVRLAITVRSPGRPGGAGGDVRRRRRSWHADNVTLWCTGIGRRQRSRQRPARPRSRLPPRCRRKRDGRRRDRRGAGMRPRRKLRHGGADQRHPGRPARAADHDRGSAGRQRDRLGEHAERVLHLQRRRVRCRRAAPARSPTAPRSTPPRPARTASRSPPPRGRRPRHRDGHLRGAVPLAGLGAAAFGHRPNAAQAGRTIPVRFAVGGAGRANVIAGVRVAPVACAGSSTVAAGDPSLTAADWSVPGNHGGGSRSLNAAVANEQGVRRQLPPTPGAADRRLGAPAHIRLPVSPARRRTGRPVGGVLHSRSTGLRFGTGARRGAGAAPSPMLSVCPSRIGRCPPAHTRAAQERSRGSPVVGSPSGPLGRGSVGSEHRLLPLGRSQGP